MIRTALALLLLLTVSASAQLAGSGANNGPSFPRRQNDFGMGLAGTTGTGTPPPVCSNSLDFTDGCNSQYLSVMRF